MFGRLTAIERAEDVNGKSRWKCRCECGAEVLVRTASLRSETNKTRSCGCLRKEVTAENHFTHRLKNHKMYDTWYGMNQRCSNSFHRSFENYGGRGISICDEWIDGPTNFIKWCETQEPIPEGYTLDRINNDGNYFPNNCRFASRKEQDTNKRERKDKRK